jgi:hypothetical protein
MYFPLNSLIVASWHDAVPHQLFLEFNFDSHRPLVIFRCTHHFCCFRLLVTVGPFGFMLAFMSARVLSLEQFLRKHWSCLTTFGTSIGWSKMEHPGGAEIAGSHLFCRLVDPTKGLLGFM